MKKSVAITTIVAIHAAVIGILLIQAGCSSDKDAQQPPKAAATEEVTTIAADDKTVAETETAKIEEGNPALRARPTKPAWNLEETPKESAAATAQPAVKDDLNDAIEPAPTAKKSAPEAGAAEAEGAAVYTVKKGDSVSKIAAKHGTSTAKILALNNISNANSIKIGQKLKVPSKGANPAIEAEKAQEIAPAPAGEELSVYVVQKGDSLSKIAAKNDMSVSQLMKINSLKNANIRVGQKLSVKKSGAANEAKAQPEKAEKKPSQKSAPKGGEIEHKVKAGEFLGSIAAKYSVKVADIKKRNNITDPRKLRAGQTIIIPAGAKDAAAKDAKTVDAKTEQAKPQPEAKKADEAKEQKPAVAPDAPRAEKPAIAPEAPKEAAPQTAAPKKSEDGIEVVELN